MFELFMHGITINPLDISRLQKILYEMRNNEFEKLLDIKYLIDLVLLTDYRKGDTNEI